MNVWFDRDKMDSILKNLLSNALKYTPRMVMSMFVPTLNRIHGA